MREALEALVHRFPLLLRLGPGNLSVETAHAEHETLHEGPLSDIYASSSELLRIDHDRFWGSMSDPAVRCVSCPPPSSEGTHHHGRAACPTLPPELDSQRPSCSRQPHTICLDLPLASNSTLAHCLRPKPPLPLVIAPQLSWRAVSRLTF